MSRTAAKRGLRNVLLEVAAASFEQGVGYFQQTVILKETARRLGMDHAGEGACELLTAWHRLLAEGLLDPGCDLDNPDLPFLHLTPKGMKLLKKKRMYPGH